MLSELPPSKRRFTNLSTVSKYLYCSICKNIFTDPQRLQCGHTFCKHCILEWAKKKLWCPLCRSSFKPKDMQRDLVGYNMVNELEVYCIHRGCPWKNSLQNLNEHLKNCYFDPNTIPECIKHAISKDEKGRKKNKEKSDFEEFEEENAASSNVSFNTNASLKARLYYKNRTLMEKVLSKKKEVSACQSIFDFFNL